MDVKNELINWLRDAYAMERGLEATLEKISRSERHPAECREACEKHLTETQRHAQTVQSILQSLDADTSNVKTSLGILSETLKGVGTAMAKDEVIKDLLASYAAEHFEIAAYTAIVAAAEEAGLPEIAKACEGIISDEKNMADTISDALPFIARKYLSQDELANAA